MRQYVVPRILVVLATGACASSAAVNQERDPVLVMIGNGSMVRYAKDVRVMTADLSGSPASHWRQLNAAFGALGLPITQRDSVEHVLASRETALNGRFGDASLSRVLDCGRTTMGAQRADAYRVWLSVASQLQESGNGTTLRTTVVARAMDPSSSTAPIQCGSTGVLEEELAKQLGAP